MLPLLLMDTVCAADDFTVAEIASGVFVHQGRQLALDVPGHDDIANLGFVVGSRCIAVIDSGGSMRAGRALRAAIRTRSQLPICYVINTHVHVDHVLGNAAFRDDHPHFVGHAALAAAIVRNREFFLKNYAADLDAPASAAQIIAPDMPVATTLELDLGDRRITLRAWPNAHTDCDLTVYDARTRTLFTGDLLFRARLPALDASVKGWLAAIDELAKLPAAHVVPGHGEPAKDGASAFAPERRYLQALEDGVRAAIKQGQSMQWAIEHVAIDEKPHWLLWDDVHPHDVARVYQELEWE